MSGEAGETSNNMTADSINKHIPIHPIFRHHLQHTIIWTHENACCHAILAPSIYRFRDMKLLNNLSQQKILWASNKRKFGRGRCLMASDTALFVESCFFFYHRFDTTTIFFLQSWRCKLPLTGKSVKEDKGIDMAVIGGGPT